MAKYGFVSVNKNLNNILNDNDADNLNYINQCERDISDKFQNFMDNKEVQQIVGTFISNIYENRKDDALKIMKDINGKNIGY